MKRVFLGLVLGLLVSSVCCADTLILKDGRNFDGTFKSRQNGTVTFETNGMAITVPEADVKALTLGKGGAAQVQPSSSSAVKSQPAPQTGTAVTVPAGTVLHVRMQDSLDTRQHGNGHRFTAVMEADVVVNGVVAIPRGSTVYGQVTNAKQAGHLVGKSGATLIFTGVMINNQIKPIHSGQIQTVNESGSGRKTVRRTATGAIIGGLVDGSDGAKTGAAIGLGLSLLTRGDSLKVPSGTLLDVSLASPFAP
jgi:hypothetical protein